MEKSNCGDRMTKEEKVKKSGRSMTLTVTGVCVCVVNWC